MPPAARSFTCSAMAAFSRARPDGVFVTHSIPEAVRIGSRILLLSAHPGQARGDDSTGATHSNPTAGI